MGIREEILNEIDRFEQSGISLDTNNFIENLKTIVKASAMPEWVSVDERLPDEGQKCLVIFEMRHSKDDAYRYINIDYFNEGDFDSVVNWEDQANSVALPAGSVISRFKALYWSSTDLSVEHLIFDEAQELSND